MPQFKTSGSTKNRRHSTRSRRQNQQSQFRTSPCHLGRGGPTATSAESSSSSGYCLNLNRAVLQHGHEDDLVLQNQTAGERYLSRRCKIISSPSVFRSKHMYVSPLQHNVQAWHLHCPALYYIIYGFFIMQASAPGISQRPEPDFSPSSPYQAYAPPRNFAPRP